MTRAVFLDRDAVLIEDVHPLTNASDIRVLESVPQALRNLKEAGFQLIVVSNQIVVARGLIAEQEVYAINAEMERLVKDVRGEESMREKANDRLVLEIRAIHEKSHRPMVVLGLLLSYVPRISDAVRTVLPVLCVRTR